MKTKSFNYYSKDSKKYEILISEVNEKIILNLITSDSSFYISKYRLEFLNEKLGKIIKFNKASQFINCLIENIIKNTMVVEPPYKNVITTIWKLFPNDSKKEESFTLISSKKCNQKLSIIFYSSHKRAEKISDIITEDLNLIKENKNENRIEFIYNNGFYFDNIIFLEINDKEEKYDEKMIYDKQKIFFNIIEENIKSNKKEFRTVLIFFDEPNLEDLIINTSNKFYKEQIFIIILSSKIIEELKMELEYRINKFSETKKTYFDMNNIYFLELNDYEKIHLPLLKIYNYFNQYGDGFFKELSYFYDGIKGYEEEFNYLFKTHYFNIILCGLTGSGKSTFINKIIGEKKAFILSNKSIGTYRNNYYIHKKYPIKIIDVCGFAEGIEGKINLNKLEKIYKKDNKNILIDEYANDIFTFYGDKRNNIHLIIYFNIYNNKYDILPGEKEFVKQAISFKIPLIFVVNKCDDKIFINEEEKDELRESVEYAKKGTFYENCETVFINCITKKGLDELLSIIYDKFEKYIISDEDIYIN